VKLKKRLSKNLPYLNAIRLLRAFLLCVFKINLLNLELLKLYSTLLTPKLIEVIMRLLLTLLIITISGYAFAEEEAAELPPLNPKYKAEHAIALVNKGS